MKGKSTDSRTRLRGLNDQEMTLAGSSTPVLLISGTRKATNITELS